VAIREERICVALPLAGVRMCLWRVGGGGAGVYIPAAAAEGIVGRISCLAFWRRKKKYLNDTAVNCRLEWEGD
jgi:hypothetical protein